MGKSLPSRKAKKGGKATPMPPNLVNLQQASAQARTDHGKAKNSRQDYNGYIKNGQKFLDAMLDGHRKTGSHSNEQLKELQVCLDIPNQWTAEVIQLFIVQKCFTEGCKKSTADGIQAAWADHFDSKEGYEGSYSYDTISGVRGNPARACKVMDTVHNVKKRDRDAGAAATRNHAEAITIEEMQQIYGYSIKECPQTLVDKFLLGKATEHERDIVVSHTRMRAFKSTAFTLWTRNFETCSLKRRDLTFNCSSAEAPHEPCFRVWLQGRKGHLNKSDSDCSRESNEYDIYNQPDLPAINMYYHLLVWYKVYQKIIGRDLTDDELVFPQVGANCVVYTTSELAQTTIQSLIDEFAAAAGLTRRFTTHSFRRGGAQYRFMFAPIGQRWSLKIVRWWGGWAQNEGVNTLMNYLLDSLNRYENSYGDALRTTRVDRVQSFMGDHSKLRAVSIQDLQQAMYTERNHTQDAIQSACFASMAQLQTNLLSHSTFLTPPVTFQQGQDWYSPSYSQAFYPNDSAKSIQYSFPLNQPNSTILSSQSSQQALSGHIALVSASSTANPTGPPADACIPNIPKTTNGWRAAVDQWFQKDPKTGKTLQQWPREWYSGKYKAIFGVKRATRKLIALEWERLGSSDEAFLFKYGSECQTITRLLKAIRREHGMRRASKNGTPTERDLRSDSEDSDSN